MKTNLHFNRVTGAGRMVAATLLSLGLWLLSGATAARAQSSFNQPGGVTYNADGTISLRWTGPGSLESAPGLGGPWTTVTGGTSYLGTATEPVGGSMGFFRLNTGSRTGIILPAPTIPPLPPIASATIQRLQTPTPVGDTLLQVVFQAQPAGAVSSSNFFELNDQIYLLRDDGVYPDTTAGDGIYSVIIPLDTNDLVAWNNHVDYVAANGNLQQPVFTGRVVTSSNTLSKFDLNLLLTHVPIQLLPFPCSLGASDLYDWRKTILITDLSVVSDPVRTFDPCGSAGTPMGPWTFGFLMSNMCNQAVTGINPSDFVRTWLMNWEFDQNINFDNVPNRSNAIVTQVINNWLGTPPATNLNLANAPFRLLAIVNRLDLRSHNFPYDNAGECRFVFGVLDPSNPCSPSPLPFTVIFEFGVPRAGCNNIKAWAAQWAALNSMPFGPAYNAALEAITDQVTLAGADPTKPNLSSINQIRSNDLLDSPWDLREFIIGPTGYLVEHTVKNTPANMFNDMPLVTTYCNDPTNVPNILIDNFTVPVVYASQPFLGGHAPTPPGLIWNGFPPGSIPPPARIHFSLNTCNGCHAGETATSFKHIEPRPPGAVSALSAFLTGENVVDPGGSGITNRYSDLARRVADLDMVINKPCVCLSLLRPITMPH